MCQLWPDRHKVLLFVFCSQLKAFLRSSFCGERASVWHICWNNRRRLWEEMSALMPRSGCPSDHRRSSYAPAWPLTQTWCRHAAFFLLGERTTSVFVTYRFKGLPDVNLWFLLTKGRNPLQFFTFKTDSTQLVIIPSFPGSPQDVGISHRDKNQLPIKFRAGNSWKSRKPPQKMKFWDVHSWGHTWSSWMMAPWFCWTKGDFRLLRSRRGGIDRTGMLRRTRSKTSRTPQQTHHWCSFICRPLEHRQNIWLLTFSAELSKPALQEIRRFSFLADGLSV